MAFLVPLLGGLAKNAAKDFIREKAFDAVSNLPSSGPGHAGGEASVQPGFDLRRPGYEQDQGFKRGGKVKSKPKVSSASKRADGIAQRGKTKGRYI